MSRLQGIVMNHSDFLSKLMSPSQKHCHIQVSEASSQGLTISGCFQCGHVKAGLPDPNLRQLSWVVLALSSILPQEDA
jgi:hypothetical protein